MTISILKGIRFKTELFDLIEQCRGKESFSRFVKKSVIMRIRATKAIAEESATNTNTKENPNIDKI
jgi:hypothetical protein